MKKERKDSTRNHIKAMLALFCVMFIVLSVYLGYIVNVYGNRWFASPYNTRVANRKGTIAAGMLLAWAGEKLAILSISSLLYRMSLWNLPPLIQRIHTGGDTTAGFFTVSYIIWTLFSSLLLALLVSLFPRKNRVRRSVKICGV